MAWKKLGLIFAPHNNHEWMISHAALPFSERIDGDVYRIFFSCRDAKQRAHIGFIDVDLKQPQDILRLAEKPILAPGALGTFEDSGVMLSWITQHEHVRYLYYVGWNLGVTVPFRNSVGLAVRGDKEEQYRRLFEGPILDRSMTEPHFSTNPCVLLENGIWKMWYISCVGWEHVNSAPKHRYHIKYAESKDGIHWIRDGVVCIDFKSNDEYAISRPCVIRDPNGYKMWYSYRGTAYRIGYAESKDGIHWTRKDEQAGIDPSPTGWDSEMIEYAYVFDHEEDRYMLYNGNRYGKTGFGLAILRSGGEIS